MQKTLSMRLARAVLRNTTKKKQDMFHVVA